MAAGRPAVAADGSGARVSGGGGVADLQTSRFGKGKLEPSGQNAVAVDGKLARVNPPRPAGTTLQWQTSRQRGKVRLDWPE